MDISAGPRSVWTGPTTPGCASAKTADPAAPRSASDTSPRSMSDSVRPRSAASCSKVTCPASSLAFAAAAASSLS